MYVYYFATVFTWKRWGPNPFHPSVLCAKIDWNCSAQSKTIFKNVHENITDKQDKRLITGDLKISLEFSAQSNELNVGIFEL